MRRLLCWLRTRHAFTGHVWIEGAYPVEGGTVVVARRECVCGHARAWTYGADLADADR